MIFNNKKSLLLFTTSACTRKGLKNFEGEQRFNQFWALFRNDTDLIIKIDEEELEKTDCIKLLGLKSFELEHPY